MHASPLMDISRVNFSDPQDICRFVSMLCEAAGSLGMAMPEFKPTKDTNAIRQLANKVVRKLDEVMPQMAVADAFKVISAYDIAYRLAYLTVPDQKILNRYVLAAFDAMLRGNHDIDQYEMYRAVVQGIQRRDAAYFDKPLTWLTTIEEQWYTESKKGFDTEALPEYDIQNRVAILLRANLMAYEGRNQATYKQTLRRRYHNIS